MIVYWAMLIASIVFAACSYNTSRTTISIDKRKFKTDKIFTLLLVLLVVFICGFRDVVLDTSTYRADYIDTPTTWAGMIDKVNESTTGKGFYFLQGCFKILISKSHYAWFFFLAGISCFCVFRVLFKYSVDLPLSGYLFIAATTFTWLINGTRQFLVVSILFAFVDWLLEGKRVRYCLLALLLSTVHTSAIFLVPIALLVAPDEFLSAKTIFIIVVTVIGTYFSETALEFVGEFLDKDYSESLEKEGAGSSIIRFLVVCVPAVMAIIARKKVKKAPKSIILAANMSIVAACFSFASTFTNGILVGRMTIYFSIYSLYSLTWLIKNIFDRRLRHVVWFACFALYGVYFYYQIMVAWGGLEYASYILGIG